MTLTEFLLARIAEDEAAARAAYASPWRAKDDGHLWTGHDDAEEGPTVYVNGGVYANQRHTAEHIARHDPARVLAECEATRQLIELAQGLVYLREIGDPIAPSTPVGQDILEILAQPYADHPDYREEWRP